MSEKISVIIPVYNGEKYIQTCLESIFKQTYQNLEIIVINDGSTDHTGKILETLKEQDSRLYVLHKSNAGVGTARNDGLSLATGQYIVFVDADDWIDPEHINNLYQSLIETNSDIAITNLSRYFEDEKKFSIHVTEADYYQKVYTPQEWFKFQYGQPNFLSICFTVPWGKLYKKSLFDLVLYPIDKHADDDYTTWKLYLLTDRIVYTHQASYVYRVNATSLTQVGDKKEIFSYECVEERLSLLSVLGLDLQAEIAAYQWRLGFNKQHYLESGNITKYKDITLKQKLIEKYRK